MLHHNHTILASNCFVSKPLLDNIVFSVRESEHFTAESEQISAETVNNRLNITGDLRLLILISSSHNQRGNISLIVSLQLLHHYNHVLIAEKIRTMDCGYGISPCFLHFKFKFKN